MYGYYYYNDDSQYNCNSKHTFLSQCMKTSNSDDCGNYDEPLGLICDRSGTTYFYSCQCMLIVHNGNGMYTAFVQECSDGDVQLVNGGRANEGRVEHCYDRQWTPSCMLTLYTAQLICKSLRYDKQCYLLYSQADKSRNTALLTGVCV